MKTIAFNTFLVLLSFLGGYTQQECPAYSIEVRLLGAEAGKTIVLNQYVASANRTIDSLPIDSSESLCFTGENLLAPGMYNITVPTAFGQSISIDFFISSGAPQHFSLSYDLQKGMSSFEVKASPENEIFAECMRYIDMIEERGQALQLQLTGQTNPDSIAFIREQLQRLSGAIKAKWVATQRLIPESMLSLFIKAIQEPFENIDFSDARILNMPILVNLLDLYTMHLLPQDKLGEVLTERLDVITNKAKADRQVYEFIVRNRYDFLRSTTHPELEEVAVYIAEKYAVEDSAQWIDKAFVLRMAEVLRMARLNPVGSKATNLKLQDTAGNYLSIDNIQAPYIVLYFYNPGCDLCAKVTPELWKIYREYSGKGLQVLALYVDQDPEEWIPYITRYNYSWINGWDPGGNEKLYEKYDIHAIPVIYLLDSNKTVVLKDVTIERLSKKLKEI